MNPSELQINNSNELHLQFNYDRMKEILQSTLISTKDDKWIIYSFGWIYQESYEFLRVYSSRYWIPLNFLLYIS